MCDYLIPPFSDEDSYNYFITSANYDHSSTLAKNSTDYRPKRVIFNPPATVVFWKDGTKTVVKSMEGDQFNPYYGFVCALAKKIYGSNSAVKSIVSKYMPEFNKEEYVDAKALQCSED